MIFVNLSNLSTIVIIYYMSHSLDIKHTKKISVRKIYYLFKCLVMEFISKFSLVIFLVSVVPFDVLLIKINAMD